MSDDRHEKGRAEATRSDLGSNEDAEQDTPDVEAHRMEQSRVDEGSERERVDEGSDRHRIDEGS